MDKTVGIVDHDNTALVIAADVGDMVILIGILFTVDETDPPFSRRTHTLPVSSDI